MHGPLLSRSKPLDKDNAASRISAYVYGNILILAALIPETVARNDTRTIAIVAGTALSTFIAHAFAEGVGKSVRSGRQLTAGERLAELRDSVPVLSSAVVPIAVLATAVFGWLEPFTAQVIAEVAILIRIASMVFVITRLRGERPSGSTLFAAGALAVVATAIVILKVVLTH
ncbi:Integral membrane protein [Prescottella defluvii]